MTDKEKSRAYDEAIKKAKEIKEKIVHSHLSTESCKAVSEYIDTIIPELRESEDERIRKWILEKVQGYADSGIPCPDEIQIANKALAYLEKQKENPKSADSISSDCVSDAKCEDRWHKVADFLPDNPREVLCKDEAGNYFIGRYYVGEGWEISNYDDEDKPHHLNPPVSKWIDFPSEKQKEQPTNEEMIRTLRAEYEKGVADTIAKYEQKEQKPAEWSEDIIRKAVKEVGLTQRQIDWFKTNVFPPKQEWSEEDEKDVAHIIRILDDCYAYGRHDLSKTDHENLANKLIVLRPSWKPSEVQMSMLLAIINEPNNAGAESCHIALMSLYNDLKKLI